MNNLKVLVKGEWLDEDVYFLSIKENSRETKVKIFPAGTVEQINTEMPNMLGYYIEGKDNYTVAVLKNTVLVNIVKEPFQVIQIT